MDKSSAQLKQETKQQLSGRWSGIILTNLVIVAINIIFTMLVNKLDNIWALILSRVITSPLILGYSFYCIKFATYENPDISEIFNGYGRWLDAIMLNFIINVFISLWSLLLIVPGIIKSYSYRMSFYILADNPNMKIMDALNWSKRLTYGHKMRMFCIDLSFIGWLLISALTCFVGYIWLMPYMSITIANLYIDIKNSDSEYVSICENTASGTSNNIEDMRN